MTVLKDKLQPGQNKISEVDKISEAPWVLGYSGLQCGGSQVCRHSDDDDDDDERFRAVVQDAQLLHQLDTKNGGHSQSPARPIVYF